MAKKNKKKNTPLSSIMKAFCLAGHFPARTPSEFRALLPMFKQRYQELLSNLHYTPPSLSLDRNVHNREYLNILTDKENFTAYAGASRDLILGYWLSHKLVFKINADTIRFLEEEFRIELCKIDFNLLYQQVCKETIYIEFPDGAPASGAFCGCIPFASEEFSPVAGVCPLAISMVRNNDTNMNLLFAPSCTLQECLAQAPSDEPYAAAQNLICRIIAYIAYISEMADAPGTVLIEKEQPYRCYEVLPIPFKDSLVDFSSPTGWIQSGLCNYMGFLSRQNMVHGFISALKEYSPSDFILSSEHPSLDKLTPPFLRAAISWEENKIIYQYSNEIAHTLTESYGNKLLCEGIPLRLMQYLPHHTVVLSNSNSGALAMISPCQIADKTQALFFVLFRGPKHEISIIPFDVSPMGRFGPNTIVPPKIYTPLCAYIHILTVSEKRTLKKNRMNLCCDDITAISPPSPVKLPLLNQQPIEPPILRTGTNVADDFPLLLAAPINIFELTSCSIKRVPKKELASRYGFRMSPHIRAAHPHNYWVGRGEERHLEVRYLKSIKVNAKKTDLMPTTVIRKIT